MEFTQDNFDALLSKASGLEKAVQAERASKKELSGQINELTNKFWEIEKAKAAKKENELVKQGKLEQLLEQKNQKLSEFEQMMAERQKQLDDMSSKVEEYNTYKSAQQAKAMEALAKKMESIDESKRDTLLWLVKDKPIEEQGAIIDQLISLQGTPDYKVNPKGGDKTITPENSDAYKKAHKEGDIFSMISNAPTKQSL